MCVICNMGGCGDQAPVDYFAKIVFIPFIKIFRECHCLYGVCSICLFKCDIYIILQRLQINLLLVYLL